MATAISTTLTALPRDLTSPIVSSSPDFLTPNWTAHSYLYCDFATLSVAPAISEARLSYDYGRILQRDQVDYATYTRLALEKKYIRLQWTGEDGTAQTWYGFCVGQTDNRMGAVLEGTARIASGQQSFKCVGLEWFLTRRRVVTSVIDDGERVARGITFNGGKDNKTNSAESRGNRAGSLGPHNVFRYTDDFTAAAEWSASDIVKYLFAYHLPTSSDDLFSLPFELHENSVNELLWYNPTVHTHGRSLWEILNQTIDRRRGLAWNIDVETTPDIKIWLRAHTFLTDSILLANGHVVPANPNQITLDFDREVDASRSVVVTDAQRHYDQVRCQGARRTSTFTIGMPTDTMEADWAAADETEYENGPAGLAGLDIANQEARADSHRRSAKLERVFAWYRIPAAWDEKANDGDAAADNFVNPKLKPEDDEVSTTEKEPIWLAGARLLNYLALKVSHDYTTLPSTITDNTPAGGQHEFRRPFAVIFIGDIGGADRFEFVERIGAVYGDNEAVQNGDLKFNCNVRVQDRAMGIIVKANTLPHQIANPDFVAGVNAPSKYAALLDNNKLRATVTLETDTMAEVEYPRTSEISNLDEIHQTLDINLGEQFRLDYLTPNTVVDVEDGELKTSTGGFIRDDRDFARSVARAAFEWYDTDRKALTVTYRQLSGKFSLGQLITQLGAGATVETVNTLVTGIRWTFGESGSTQITTNYGQLDFGQIGARQGSSFRSSIRFLDASELNFDRPGMGPFQ